MSTLSPLCQLNGGCFGCCGNNFGTKTELQEAITKNTKEFLHRNLNISPTSESLLKFRNRLPSYNLLHGLCRNLIEINRMIFCPLHPSRNEGYDLRHGHCDIDYLCKAAQEFQYWYASRQEKFIQFILSKKLDNIDYSLMMENDSLLKEFEKEFEETKD